MTRLSSYLFWYFPNINFYSTFYVAFSGQSYKFCMVGFFLKFFEVSTLHGTLGKKFFRKNQTKTRSKHVWTLLGRFWAFLDFWKFFDFSKNFRRLDPPWNSGQNFFSNKLPQNMFKTRLDTFGNNFGHFWNFEIFSIFFEFLLSLYFIF